jgi:hypothetical protein
LVVGKQAVLIVDPHLFWDAGQLSALLKSSDTILPAGNVEVGRKIMAADYFQPCLEIRHSHLP